MPTQLVLHQSQQRAVARQLNRPPALRLAAPPVRPDLDMEAAGASRVGARLLREVEEASLDEILTTVRTTLTGARPTATTPTTADSLLNRHQPLQHHLPPPPYPLPALDALARQHFLATSSAPLALRGRPLPLLYALVAAIVAPPLAQAVLVIDVDWRFDATRLLEQAALLHDHDHGGGAGSAEEALRHVHVVRPARGSPLRTHVAAVVAEARAHMVYGEHGSRARGFWGTVVVGGERDPGTGGGRGDGAAVEVTAGWRGWCTVEREPVAGFGIREGVQR
ncbi:hypothetical protein P8C59_000999 [Phyllachora maydis]|uniref:Uncharacterized protein n=1 Tax=Phyllachora maydis TaxID=1825666 RepID=A0AAD9HXH7_9PEZI|nr:hypothetical protein P8C59_000999 [Phyllachora maydis]